MFLSRFSHSIPQCQYFKKCLGCIEWIQYIRLPTLLMKNIFIKLKPQANLKKQSLRKLLAKDEEEQKQPNPLIEQYFAQKGHSTLQNANFIISLIQQQTDLETKEKLYPILAYYTASLEEGEAKEVLETVFQSNESIFTRVKFFSLVYKSITSITIKKWLITQSIALIEREGKISIFSSFVENFDALLSQLTFDANEYVQINLKMINYLEKHLVYKKWWKHFIVQALLTTANTNATTPEVDSLILKLLRSGEVDQETVALASRIHLKANRFYPFLQQLLVGDYQAFTSTSKELLGNTGVELGELERNIKIQAIPRILSGIKNASYSQVSEILKIQKSEVESYIIEAIQKGLLKAKIDEFQETILINQVNFRALRAEDTASLQKSISTLACKLQKVAVQ